MKLVYALLTGCAITVAIGMGINQAVIHRHQLEPPHEHTNSHARDATRVATG